MKSLLTFIRYLSKRILLVLNVIAALLLLTSYLSTHINPNEFSLLPFFGMAYPVFLLVNFVFILLWLWRKKKFVYISIISILVGYNHLFNFFQISYNDNEASKNSISVMSYNVRLFDWYNWTGNIKTRNEMFKMLQKENCDVFCFQEFVYHEEKGYFETRDTLTQFLDAKNYYEGYTHVVRGGHYFGIAIFSKYPIVNKGALKFENDANNNCIFIDIKVNKDTIRVYNTHLSSIRFQKQDYQFVDSLGVKEENIKELKEGGIRIIKKLETAFVKRGSQIDIISRSIKNCPYPVVLCGDFNDTPISYTYNSMASILKDSFKSSGNGIGNTYIGIFPSFRIDYIFHSNQLKSENYKTHPQSFSDHHAISCSIELPDVKNE
jgi:endonuclease/exonuclease/phosphatase family metal-dependent hydrolase